VASAATEGLTVYLYTLLRDPPQRRSLLSMLEVIERIQMLNWNMGSQRYQGFVDCCVATFKMEKPLDFIVRWAAFQSADIFVHDILFGGIGSNTRYLLLEYERSLGMNLHRLEKIPDYISTGPIELEHVFAQSVDLNDEFNALGGFLTFGIKDRIDFDGNVLSRSGNLTWLSKSGNDSLGNKPPDTKAAHICACSGHAENRERKNVCPLINITRKLGSEMVALGSDRGSFRLYIEARCAELALFSVRRFC
jgi:hypothetical protein